MILPVDHIHHLDSYITNEGEAFESVADADLVSMNLWVPSESVAMHLIDPPSAPKRKWTELIPWILEDRLLQPIEELNFVLCGQNTEGQLQILVVSDADIQNWQRVAKNSGVAPQSMYPDYMALPYEEGRISIGWRDGVCLVRTGAVDGFAASPDIAWPMIGTLLQKDETLRVSISIPESVILPENIVQFADINDSLVDWQFSQLPSQCNLLANRQKGAFSLSGILKWIPASILGVSSILLAMLYFQTGIENARDEISILENRLTQGYSRLFDGRRPSPSNVRFEADRNIAQLLTQRESIQSEPVAGLLALNRLMRGCGCQLSALDYSKNTIVMLIENGAELKKRKLNLPGYKIAVTQQPGGDENAIELRLTSKKSGVSQ